MILKYANHLANENSLIELANIAWSLIGKNNYLSRIIYECSDKKTDFALQHCSWPTGHSAFFAWDFRDCIWRDGSTTRRPFYWDCMASDAGRLG